MGVIVPVVLIGAASAAAVIMRTRSECSLPLEIASRMAAGVGGAAAAAFLAVALQGHQGLSVALLASVAAGAGICLTSLEVLGLRGAVTFMAAVALAGVGGAAAVLGLSSAALSATALR